MRRILVIACTLLVHAAVNDLKDSFDPYAVLGVDRSASAAEIKRAYRRLAQELHPDKVGQSGGENGQMTRAQAEAKFQEVSRAYEVLSDDAARESFNIGAFTTRWEYEEWTRKHGRGGAGKGLFSRSGPVLALTTDTLARTVRDRGKKPMLLMFYASWCTHCQSFAPEYRKVALELDDEAIVAAFDCEQDEQACMNEQVPGYPTLRLLLPDGVETWSRPLTRGEEVVEWAREASRSEVVRLTAADFARSVMRSDEVWLVDFSAGAWCGPCSALKGTLRRVAAALAGRVKVGIVECDMEQHLCGEYQIGMYPYLKLFPRSSARKAALNGGRGEDLIIAQDLAGFPPGAALDIAAKVLSAVLPPGPKRAEKPRDEL